MPIGTVDWIAEGMLDGRLSNVIDERTGDISGISFSLRNQFFHGSHPLGWIRHLAVHIDAEPIPAQSLMFVLRQQPVPIWQIPWIADIWWQPRELAIIQVERRGGLKAGDYDIRCELDLSTFFFTPAIDRRNLYPTMHLRLEKRMTLLDKHGSTTL